VDVDLIGWVSVGLVGTYGCRCSILYAPMLGVVFYAGLVSLTSHSYPSPCAPYSSELIGGVFFWSAIHNEMREIRADVCKSSCVKSQRLIMSVERRSADSHPGTVVTNR